MHLKAGWWIIFINSFWISYSVFLFSFLFFWCNTPSLQVHVFFLKKKKKTKIKFAKRNWGTKVERHMFKRHLSVFIMSGSRSNLWWYMNISFCYFKLMQNKITTKMKRLLTIKLKVVVSTTTITTMN